MEWDVGFGWTDYLNVTPQRKVTNNVVTRHGSGVVVSFCDGHQSFVSTDLDYAVYAHLLTPWGQGCLDASGRPGNVDTGILDEGAY